MKNFKILLPFILFFVFISNGIMANEPKSQNNVKVQMKQNGLNQYLTITTVKITVIPDVGFPVVYITPYNNEQIVNFSIPNGCGTIIPDCVWTNNDPSNTITLTRKSYAGCWSPFNPATTMLYFKQ